jgi:glycosyltransferase involved in cell wall biosynthesis
MHRAFQKPFDQATYRRCDLLMAASRVLGRELVSKYGLPGDKICVVEPGSDLPIDRTNVPELRMGRRIAMLSVANWLPNKGVVELLEALAGLPQECATLHLVGRADLDAVYSARVHSRLTAPDLIDRVVTHGAVSREQVACLYAGADVFVVPSYQETYGTVHGEALAAGLPTVGWRSGNLPNLVEDGRQGCLLPPGDIAALTAVLGRLSTDDAWRAFLSDGARHRGELLPTWADTADAFFDALSSLATHRD